jgi:tetratricopeptide (TPR) repeat protein
MDLLVALWSRRGQTVSKEELICEVWEGRFVSDEVLTVAIFELRKALRDSARQPRYVETIPRRGYRWIPPVISEADNEQRNWQPAIAGPQQLGALSWRRYATPTAVLIVISIAVLWLSTHPRQQASERQRPQQAQAAFRLGEHFLGQRLPESIRRALSQYQEAVRIDPTYAEAHSGIAQANVMLADMGAGDSQELYRQARASAEQALALNGRLAEAHASLGMVRLFADWDFRRAEDSFRQALALDASSATAHRGYGMLFSVQGRHDQAIAEAGRAVELDPTSPARYNELAWELNLAGRSGEALIALDKGLEVDAGFFPLYISKGLMLEQSGDPEAAFAVMRQGYLRLPRGDEIVARLEAAFRREGFRGIYNSWLQVTLRGSPNMPHSEMWLAQLFSRLGQNESALQALERAFQKREGGLLWLRVDPSFQALRPEPRFQRLAEQVGAEQGPPVRP